MRRAANPKLNTNTFTLRRNGKESRDGRDSWNPQHDRQAPREIFADLTGQAGTCAYCGIRKCALILATIWGSVIRSTVSTGARRPPQCLSDIRCLS